MPLIVDASEAREVYDEARERGVALLNLNPECPRGIEACLRAAKAVGQRVGADDLPIILSLCGIYYGRPQAKYYTSLGDPLYGFDCWVSNVEFYTATDGPFGKLRVLTHLDHGQPDAGDAEILEHRLDKLTSVMYDCSTMPFEENVQRTAAYTERVRDQVIVEGAVDEMYESGTGEQKNQITTVEHAQDYVSRTGVDIIVPNLGTEHRAAERDLRYHGDMARELSSAVGKILCLHGTSSLSPEDFVHLKDDGIIKVNLWTAVEKAGAQAAVRKAIDELGNIFPETVLGKMVDAGYLGRRYFEHDYREQICGGQIKPKLDFFAECVRRDAWVNAAQALVESCLDDLGYAAFGS
ncbi:class II fructose-bisphosphate aldolase [bacterium]|nr:class II fructose-bisphosphate aldolase [bacterium]